MAIWQGLEDTKINPSDAKAIADKILEDFVDICNDLNIKYALVLGTCLGFYRDGSYIRGDNDIDIWVDCETIESERYTTLTERLLELGFACQYSYHFYRDNILVDVWARSRLPPNQQYQSISTIFLPFLDTFDIIAYSDRTYNLPHPAEKYLEYAYGEDWRIPKRKGE